MTDDNGNDERCRHDGKELLDGKNDELTCGRSVVYVVDELHKRSSK